MTTWMIMDIIRSKSRDQDTIFVSIPGLCSATVVGLVVVTPGAGYIQPGYALLMGVVGGCTVYLFLTLKKHFFHVDDTLDVFSCHGLGGFIGTIITGLVCQTDVNSEIKNGAFYGNPIQLGYEVLGILIVTAYSAICTTTILLPMHLVFGIRINRLEQVRGLDSVAHGVVINAEASHKVQQTKLTSIKQKTNTIDVEQ